MRKFHEKNDYFCKSYALFAELLPTPRERKDVGESLAKRQTKTPPHPVYTEGLKCPPKPKEKSIASNRGPV